MNSYPHFTDDKTVLEKLDSLFKEIKSRLFFPPSPRSSYLLLSPESSHWQPWAKSPQPFMDCRSVIMPGENSLEFNLLILRSQWGCSGIFESLGYMHTAFEFAFYTSLLRPSLRQVATISGLGIRANMLCSHWNWTWEDSHPTSGHRQSGNYARDPEVNICLDYAISGVP